MGWVNQGGPSGGGNKYCRQMRIWMQVHCRELPKHPSVDRLYQNHGVGQE